MLLALTKNFFGRAQLARQRCNINFLVYSIRLYIFACRMVLHLHHLDKFLGWLAGFHLLVHDIRRFSIETIMTTTTMILMMMIAFYCLFVLNHLLQFYLRPTDVSNNFRLRLFIYYLHSILLHLLSMHACLSSFDCGCFLQTQDTVVHHTQWSTNGNTDEDEIIT